MTGPGLVRTRSITRLRRGRTAGSLASVVVLLGASGCSVAGADPIGEGPDTLRVVLPEEPPTLEPCDASLTATGRVTRANITEALTERDPATGELEQALATKWTRNSPTSWTFTLRKGVRFHDDSAFTAAAAAFSIKRATDSDLNCNVDGYIFADSEVTATPVDDTTLEVTTANRTRSFPCACPSSRSCRRAPTPTPGCASRSVRGPTGSTSGVRAASCA